MGVRPSAGCTGSQRRRPAGTPHTKLVTFDGRKLQKTKHGIPPLYIGKALLELYSLLGRVLFASHGVSSPIL